MPLDRRKLHFVHELDGGAYRAQCPACAEIDGDRTGHHLYVFPSGAYGCAARQGDPTHRKRIWELAKPGEGLSPPSYRPRRRLPW
jgi:hypothetical protein